MTTNDGRLQALPDEGEYPRELLERFELVECFCAREESQTLLARDRRTGALCVVKAFLRGGALYDRAEPEALKALDAPPLPRFVAEYRGEAMRCVLREYVPGRTLAELAAERAFTQGEIIAIGSQLCDQLSGLHGHVPPIVHRDIKPQNVVVRPDGKVVLIDFGISRVVSEAASDTVVFGTQGYAPPEQYGFAQTDSRSDIYSLGILLAWLMIGKAEPPQRPRTALERVIRRCAAFDPRKRFASAERVKRALNGAQPGARRRRGALIALAGMLAVVALIACLTLLRRPEPLPAFSQPLIEQAARLSLGLDEGEPLTAAMLGEVTGIYIVADAAYPDADSFYPAVNRWYAEGRPTRGGVDDLDDCRLMPNLAQVCVAAQEIRDLSALAALENLDKVEIKHNYVSDISPLAGKLRLTSVGINDNPVTDISPLLDCPNLSNLDLCDVRSYDPSVIGKLGNFSLLDISNPTESYNYLSGKSVLSLHLSWTGLTALDVLDGVTRLEDLQIAHTAVTDLGPLVNHPGLKALDIAAIPAKDLTPLLSLPMLERVKVSADMLPLVEALGETPFAVETE